MSIIILTMKINNLKNKVIHIVTSLNVGGAERFVIDLIEQQKKSLCNIEILSFGSPADILTEVAIQRGIKVNIIENVSTILGQLKLFNTLRHIDIIHIHSPHIIKPISIAIRLIGKKRLIYTRHGEDALSSRCWKRRHKFFRKFVNHMTFVSQKSKDIFCQTYAWAEIKKEVVDNGVVLPENVIEKTGINLKLGAVGRFVPLKNQICLMKAINLFPDSYKKLVEIHLFGDGKCYKELSTYANKQLSNVKVIFHGMIQDREVIYNSFDLLVVCSETEGLSLAIMEAMAYGIPVVATDVGGNSRLVKDKENGWLFNYNDVERLSTTLKNILDNDSEYKCFSVKSREYISGNFSIKSTADKYLSIYS